MLTTFPFRLLVFSRVWAYAAAAADAVGTQRMTSEMMSLAGKSADAGSRLGHRFKKATHISGQLHWEITSLMVFSPAVKLDMEINGCGSCI